jgi:8-oxo-dGTP diphosphatase
MAFEKIPPEVLRKHKGISFVGVTTVFLCYDKSGRIFLSKRSQQARDEHGKWDPGGGGLKWGSSAEDNLKRELKEEYNADPLQIDFLGYLDVFRELDDGTKTHWVALFFAVLVDPQQVRIMEPELVDDSDWFTLDNLPSPLHSQFGIFIDKFGDKINKLLNQK